MENRNENGYSVYSLILIGKVNYAPYGRRLEKTSNLHQILKNRLNSLVVVEAVGTFLTLKLIFNQSSEPQKIRFFIFQEGVQAFSNKLAIKFQIFAN